jgi:putative membrane protein
MPGRAIKLLIPEIHFRGMLATMIRLLIEWLLNALALVVTAYVVPDFEVDGFGPAVIGALVVGLLNVTLGWLLSIFTFPLVWLLPRLMMLLIDAVVLYVAAKFVPGFRIKTFLAAFIGAIVLVLIHIVFSYV